MSWLDDMTPEQHRVVEEVTKRTAHLASPKMLEDEFVFHRFCKAREFNLDKAEIMVRKHIEWRKEFKFDTILDWKPQEALVKYCGANYRCLSKEGEIIRYFDFGGTDMKGIFRSVPKEDILRYIVYLLEEDFKILTEMNKESKKKVIFQGIHVHDFKNLSYSHTTDRNVVEMVFGFLKVFQDNLPERMKNYVCINASSVFAMVFPFVKVVIAAPLLKKVSVFSNDDFKNHLLKSADKSVLPEYFGGDTEWGKPLFENYTFFAKPIPEKYFMKKSEKLLTKRLDVDRVYVKPRSRVERKLEVQELGYALEWEFETKNRDISFQVYFTEDIREDSPTEQIISNEKINTDYGPERGQLKCMKTGVYTIVFDNSYSYIHSKEVYFNLKMRKISVEDICTEASENLKLNYST